MTRHRILAVDLEGPRNPRDVAHPVRVGIASNLDPTRLERVWTVEEVLASLESGDEFYTRRPTTRGDASVFGYDCRLCGRPAIRSGPEAEEHNKLERLPRIPV